MKRFSLIAVSFIFTAVFAVSALAQTPAPAGKIGLVNINAFSAEKEGITKFKNAVGVLETEFKPVYDKLRTMNTKLQTLATEIQNAQKSAQTPGVPVNPSAIQAKVDEAQTLEVQLKREQEDAKVRYERRYQSIVGPVFNDILKAMNEYAKQKGFAMILDGAKLEEAQILLGFDDKFDVTKDFITFYNARPAGTATTATPK